MGLTGDTSNGFLSDQFIQENQDTELIEGASLGTFLGGLFNTVTQENNVTEANNAVNIIQPKYPTSPVGTINTTPNFTLGDDPKALWVVGGVLGLLVLAVVLR